MGARQKLNEGYLFGAIAVASIFGLLAQSWTVFFVFTAVQLLASLCVGNFRSRGRDGQKRRGATGSEVTPKDQNRSRRHKWR